MNVTKQMAARRKEVPSKSAMGGAVGMLGRGKGYLMISGTALVPVNPEEALQNVLSS